MNFCEFFYSGDQLLCHYKEFPSELTSLGKLFCSYSWAIKWLGLILGLNTWPVPSHPRKKGLVVERPNVCGLAATISPCWMKWKSCVVIGCSFGSVFYLKPQGCIFMLALWKCHLCFSSSVWLMHFLLPDVTLTCISHSTISKLNKGHLNPLWKFPSLWKVVDNNLNTPVL